MQGRAVVRIKVCAETLARIGFPIPGNIQGGAGRCCEQPGVVEDVPAHGRGLGSDTCKGPFNPSRLRGWNPLGSPAGSAGRSAAGAGLLLCQSRPQEGTTDRDTPTAPTPAPGAPHPAAPAPLLPRRCGIGSQGESRAGVRAHSAPFVSAGQPLAEISPRGDALGMCWTEPSPEV